jgi:hypothetical protein
MTVRPFSFCRTVVDFDKTRAEMIGIAAISFAPLRKIEPSRYNESSNLKLAISNLKMTI